MSLPFLQGDNNTCEYLVGRLTLNGDSINLRDLLALNDLGILSLNIFLDGGFGCGLAPLCGTGLGRGFVLERMLGFRGVSGNLLANDRSEASLGSVIVGGSGVVLHSSQKSQLLVVDLKGQTC